MSVEEQREVLGERQKAVNELGFFRKQSELMFMLPEVSKLREIFDMFAMFGKEAGVRGSAASSRISMSELADCLRSMGLNLSEQWLGVHLEKQVQRREALGLPGMEVDRRVTFEMALTLYCQADRTKEPSAEEIMRALRTFDPKGTGMMPYSKLRHLLTNMAERLDESEVYGLLHRASDSDGNVHYEDLVREMFGKDPRAGETLLQAKIYLKAVGRNALDMDMAKRDEFIDALREADPLNSGFIEPQRLLALLNRRNKSFTIDELQVLTEGMEEGSHGINYRRFLRSIMNE